jgi:hypothetical protein
VLPDELRGDKIVTVVKNVVGDRSWRVRWSVAGSMVDLCEVMGADVTQVSERRVGK